MVVRQRARGPKARVFSRVAGSMAILALVGVFVGACGSDAEQTPANPPTDHLDSPDSSLTAAPDAIAPAADGDATVNPTADAGPCVPQPIDCTGLCGPVKDSCSGEQKFCGGCPTGDVCDLATHTCGVPKVNCAQLGAECGTAKNSCGTYIDCPDGATKGCPTGKECDPDTNKCKDCTNVTCNDLGYECGMAWLGCGDTNQLTNCGTCDSAGARPRCNAVFKICEPNCVAKTAKELCDAAKTRVGLECGIISDGCGGTVDCDKVAGYGCASGESCGVHGIANRCDAFQTPPECESKGRECGELTSVCDGKKIDCGKCANPGDVCNPDGTCGPPCTPKTCADYNNPQCGSFPSGCRNSQGVEGTITCGGCGGNGVCKSDNTCCTTNSCPAPTANGTPCGTALDKGCGQTMNCGCGTGQTCTSNGGNSSAPAAGAQGLCCTKRTCAYYTALGQCGTNLSDGCGGVISGSCGCTGPNGVCTADGQAGPSPTAGQVGMCCTRNACASNSCSSIANSCRTDGSMISCSTCTSGNVCGGSPASCCAPATCGTTPVTNRKRCEPSSVNNGCTTASCTCNSNQTCYADPADTGVKGCCTKRTCSGFYAGQCGTALDDGCGGTINCGCSNPKSCSSTTAGTAGTCQCPSGTPLTCLSQNKPAVCGSMADGCGGTITCNCSSGTCYDPAGATPAFCCQPATCPTAALGSACGSLTNNCGGTISCGCPSGNGFENFACSAGHCACVPDTCRGRVGPQPDRCGGTLQCGG